MFIYTLLCGYVLHLESVEERKHCIAMEKQKRNIEPRIGNNYRLVTEPFLRFFFQSPKLHPEPALLVSVLYTDQLLLPLTANRILKISQYLSWEFKGKAQLLRTLSQ